MRRPLCWTRFGGTVCSRITGSICPLGSLSGSLRRRFHAENLHPRHPAKARAGRRKDGKFYGQGHVKAGQQAKNGWNFLPRSIQPFSFISACGSRCGSRQKADRTKPDHRKKQLETLSEISVLICRQAQISFALRFDCPYPAQKIRNNLAICNKNLAFHARFCQWWGRVDSNH